MVVVVDDDIDVSNLRTADVGDGNPLRSGDIDRYFATHAHQSGGPALHSRAAEGEGL